MCAHIDESVRQSPARSRQWVRRWLRSGAVAVAVASLAGCTASAGTTATPATPAGLCDRANELTDAGEPQRALDLIASFRAGLPTPAPVGSIGTADLACVETARLTAIDQLGVTDLTNATTPPSPPTLFGTVWDAQTADWVLPLVPPGLAVLGLVAALFIIARLASFYRKTSLRKPLPNAAIRMTRQGAGMVIAGTVLAVASFALLAVDAGRIVGTVFAVLLIVAVVGTVTGTWRLARGLASTLRMDIKVLDVSGTSNSGATSLLVSYVAALGTRPPEGMELPIGADVNILPDAALTASSDQKAIAFLTRILELLLGNTPWKAIVNRPDDDNLTLHIARNGRNVNTVIIRRVDFPVLAADPLDLNKLAAAAILTTLADHYLGFAGLCGATEWQSVGLHYIATSDFGGRNDRALPILATALEYDPKNRAARLAMRHHQYRDAAGADDLGAFACWLRHEYDDVRALEEQPPTDLSTTQSPYLDYKRRLLLNYVVAAMNLRSLNGSRSSESTNALRLARDLNYLLSLAGPPPDPLPALMKSTAQTALTVLAGPVTDAAATDKSLKQLRRMEKATIDVLTLYRPTDAYNRACTLATQAAESATTKKAAALHERSIRLLSYAFMLPEFKRAAAVDPSLASLHEDAAFGALLGWAPRASFWEVEPFTGLRPQLQAFGVSEPFRLAELSRLRPNLRLLLDIPEPQFQRLQRLSRLMDLSEHVAVASTDLPALSVFKVELVAELFTHGMETVQETVSLPLAETMRAAILRRNHRAPTTADIEQWLIRLHVRQVMSTWSQISDSVLW